MLTAAQRRPEARAAPPPLRAAAKTAVAPPVAGRPSYPRPVRGTQSAGGATDNARLPPTASARLAPDEARLDSQAARLDEQSAKLGDPLDGSGGTLGGGAAGEKDGAAAGAGHPPAATAGPIGRGGGRGAAAPDDAGGADASQQAEAPVPETGPHQIADRRLDIIAQSAPFDAPRALTVRPDKPPTDSDAKNPDIGRYRSVFAEAATAAAHLHADLLRHAERATNDARNAAEARLSNAQRTLDSGLAGLETALGAARASLATDADTAILLLGARAGGGKAAIRAAASRAEGTLRAAAKRMHADYDKLDPDPDDIESDAQAKLDTLVSDGDEAAAQISLLGTNVASEFPDTGKTLPDAQLESVIEGMPDRADKRSGYFSDQTEAHQQFLEKPLDQLPILVTNATSAFNQLINRVDKQGPAAVGKARDGAIRQIDASVARIKAAIEQARDRNDAVLIRQNNAARRQMIDTSEARAKSEQQAATAHTERNQSRIAAAARGQATAIKTLDAGFDGERRRPAAEFAAVVIQGSLNIAARLRSGAPEQQARLDQSIAESRATLDRQSGTTSARLDDSATASAAALEKLAHDAGGPLVQQADQGSAGFINLAGPVGKAMDAYLTPFDKAYDGKLTDMKAALVTAKKSFNSMYDTGKGGGDKKDGGGETTSVTPPKQVSKEFETDAARAAADAKTDTLIKEFIDKAEAAVASDVTKRTNDLTRELGKWSASVNAVMAALRGLTAKSGAAVAERYGGRAPLEAAFEDKLRKYLSTGGTDDANVNAAKGYLAGDDGPAGLEEMKAAVNWINDDERVEAVQRSLSPADLKKLADMGKTAELDAIQADLDGNNQKVLGLLRKGDDDSVAEANAIRTHEAIVKARGSQGNEGGDQTFAAIKTAAITAGNDRLSGAERVQTDDTLGRELAAERNAKAWAKELEQFAKIEPIPKGEENKIVGADGKPYTGPGAALYRYAIQTRTYTKTTYDPDSKQRTTEVSHEALSHDQAMRLEKVLIYGPDSPEVAATTLLIETKRAGGKVDKDKLDEALHDKSLDARVGEVLTPEQRADREKKAQERFDDIYKKFGEYSGDKRSPQEIRDSLVEKVGAAYADNKYEKAYVQSILATPGGDPVAAADFAIEGAGTNTDLLKKTLKRMNREQVDDFMTKYNDKHPGDPLYKRLGVYGEGDWSLEAIVTGNFPETSGDDRNDLQILLMGQPGTDRERAEVARLTAKQQIDQAGGLGALLAHEEYHNLVASSDQLRQQMGFSSEEYDSSFDKRGRFIATNPVTGKANPLGHFNAKGDFQPPDKDSSRLFEDSVAMATLSAENYKQATDRIATYITTTLVVVAAIVTTVLTFGAGASIWIPVLVTAGAGLLGMGASALIKGGRYGYDDASRDLAMTVIQAATAGLGAAAGAALRGGLPALRVAAGAFKVSEAALAAAAEGGGVAFAKSLTLAQEIGVGVATGAFAGGGNALLDDQAWREGRYGTNILHGLFRGALGGGAGAGASKLGAGTIGRLAGGGRSLAGLAPLAEGAHPNWAIGLSGRAAGAAGAGFGQSLTEAGYASAVQGRHMTSEEMLSEAGWAALQNAIQGIGEGAYEQRGMAKQQAAHGAAGGRPTVAPEEAAPTRGLAPVQEGEPPPLRPAPAPAEEPGPSNLRRTPAPVEGLTSPAPRPSPGPVEETAPLSRPPAPTEEAQPTISRPPPAPTLEAEPPILPRPAPAEEIQPSVPRPPPAPAEETEPPTLRRPEPEPEPDDATVAARLAAKAAAQGPKPEWLVLAENLPPGSVVIATDATNPSTALAEYRGRVKAQPHLEVAIYRNTETGEFIVVQGDPTTTFAERVKGTGDIYGPAGAGTKQDWKTVLFGNDVGDWQLAAHFHPVDGSGDTAGMPRRLPSGKGADMSVIEAESLAAGGEARRSRIDFLENGELRHTDFGYDPGLPGGPFWVDLADPVSGVRSKTAFPTVEAYHDFFKETTGLTLLEAGHAAAVAPGVPPPVPRDDDYVFHHGTTQTGQTDIERGGILAQRKPGRGEDFSAGFYVTPQEDVGQTYAKDRVGKVREGGPGAVLSFRISKADMGLVIDIRPGGEHRAAWESFLDRPSPYAMMGPEYLAQTGLPATIGEYVVRTGHDVRGEYFERFLAENGWSNADAVHGDVGGRGTAGIGSERPGAEQIAIRSQRLADLLSQQLPGRVRPTVPVPETATIKPAPAGIAEIGTAGTTGEAAVAPPAKPVVQPEPTGAAKLLQGVDIDAEIDRIFPKNEPVLDKPPTTVPLDKAQMAADKQAVDERSAERKRLFALAPELLDQKLRQLDAGTTTLDDTVEAFRQAREAANPADPADAAKDAQALRTLLEHRQKRVDAEFALKKIAMKPIVDALNVSDKLKALVMESPTLLEMVHQNPALGEKRLKRMSGRFRGKNFTTERFEQGWQDYYVPNQLPATSELDAMFRLGDRAWDIIQGGGRANKHGIDIIAIERPPSGDPTPTQAKLHLVDDKAYDATSVNSVTALTENLEGNLRKSAAAFQQQLEAQRKAGIGVEPLHELAAKQLLQAADDLKLLKSKSGGTQKIWEDPAYAKSVRALLKANGIEMWITSARGSVERVSSLLGEDGYGFRMLFNQQRDFPLPKP